MKKNEGFTLIEILVVIAIISLLSSVIFARINSTKLKARTARSIEELRQLQNALEMYYGSNNSYPNSEGGSGPWDGLYTCWGDSTTDWISGLAPNYIRVLPRAPNNITDCDKQYIYRSNGTDYKLIWHNPEDCSGVKSKYPNLIDPMRDCWAYGYWTPGARNW